MRCNNGHTVHLQLLSHKTLRSLCPQRGGMYVSLDDWSCIKNKIIGTIWYKTKPFCEEGNFISVICEQQFEIVRRDPLVVWAKRESPAVMVEAEILFSSCKKSQKKTFFWQVRHKHSCTLLTYLSETQFEKTLQFFVQKCLLKFTLTKRCIQKKNDDT